MSDPVTLASTTPRFDLPLLFMAQAQKEAFVNEALVRIDTLLHPAAVGELSDPPAGPSAGSTWLVAAEPAGTWSGHAGALATWTGDQWIFVEPREGMTCRDLSDGSIMRYAAGWQRIAAPELAGGGTTVDTECRAALTGLISALRAFGIFPS